MAVATWKTAWIIGASTGIGRQLAVDLARAGVSVAASARSAEKLADLAAAHDGIHAYPVDVADAPMVNDTSDKIEADLGAIDLVVFCSAVWHPMGAETFDAGKANHSFEVNVGGANILLGALLPRMLARRTGQIALVSSVAGYRGLPKAAAYGPTKAALINLAESLHADAARHGVNICVVNPGFVETPMTADNDFPMPFLMKAEEASRRIIQGLARRKFEIAFPWRFVFMLKLARILPYAVYFWYVRTFILKRSAG